MGFKPNYRKKFNISDNLQTQIKEAFDKPATISGQFLGIRNIHHGAFNKRTVIFSSIKNGGAFSLESQLELAHALNLERDSRVLKYRTQALKFMLTNDSYAIPDFLILNNLKEYEVHEVKSNLNSLSTSQLEKLKLTKQIVNSYNIEYKIYDEIFLLNLKEVNSLLRIYKNIKNIELNTEKINFANSITRNYFQNFTEALDHLSKYKFSYNEVCYLVFYKHLQVNINI
ncbi:hypothetical protein E0H86_01015 [Acinetobacter sp. ANC 4635]|uniref:hypothetical protein n=1 Tax=Acinetobacter sp. ANC 4635 TaxID=2529846 RepID=UPI001039CEA5|nr:hypothetical protein [Acinetobacter sp. ANC 4635]TCB33251.1 hypothetical protein E0H86_01015 [Acinetobacter sp. ANC 4635]